MTSYQLQWLAKEKKQHKPIQVSDIREVTSLKSRTCVYCGDEIPKGDRYYSYKPIFGKRKARCLKCPPKIYNDIERFDN